MLFSRIVSDEHREFEQLNQHLNDREARAEYQTPYENYHASLLPRLLGKLLMGCGNLVYGRKPTYQKFRAIEVIARVPYQSWASAIFTLLTIFYGDELRALRLSTLARFARFASDNETMHVVVISKLAREHERAGILRHTLIPMLFSFFYFWMSYLLYLLKPRWSLEMNYMFESHAFHQYSLFLELHGEELKRRSVMSEFLAAYGRHPVSQYEFFESVRNDELIHRNRSIREIEMNLRRGL